MLIRFIEHDPPQKIFGNYEYEKLRKWKNYKENTELYDCKNYEKS